MLIQSIVITNYLFMLLLAFVLLAVAIELGILYAVKGDSELVDEGRGSYDTTGLPKPKPKPDQPKPKYR